MKVREKPVAKAAGFPISGAVIVVKTYNASRSEFQMNHNSTMGTQSEGKSKKMTRAEFMFAFDEMNVKLQKIVAQARDNQSEARGVEPAHCGNAQIH